MTEAWRKKLEDEIVRQGREMKEISKAAGLGETYVRDALKRGRGKMENLRKISVALGHTPDWLTSDESGRAATDPAIIPQPNASAPFALPPLSAKRLPVYGQAVGGVDGRFIFNGELMDTTICPPGLENVPGAYGVFVSGESMWPRFEPGETAWVHPRRPARRGDDVVVQLHPEHEGDPPEGYIKRFVAWTPSLLILEQFNPKKEIEIEKALVISVHVIVGSMRL